MMTMASAKVANKGKMQRSRSSAKKPSSPLPSEGESQFKLDDLEMLNTLGEEKFALFYPAVSIFLNVFSS